MCIAHAQQDWGGGGTSAVDWRWIKDQAGMGRRAAVVAERLRIQANLRVIKGQATGVTGGLSELMLDM